jgi:hypothetical protein
MSATRKLGFPDSHLPCSPCYAQDRPAQHYECNRLVSSVILARAAPTIRSKDSGEGDARNTRLSMPTDSGSGIGVCSRRDDTCHVSPFRLLRPNYAVAEYTSDGQRCCDCGEHRRRNTRQGVWEETHRLGETVHCGVIGWRLACQRNALLQRQERQLGCECVCRRGRNGRYSAKRWACNAYWPHEVRPPFLN